MLFKKEYRLRYALAKQVPDMVRGFTIATSYGDIEISAEDAPRFMKLVRQMLTDQLVDLNAATRGDAEGGRR